MLFMIMFTEFYIMFKILIYLNVCVVFTSIHVCACECLPTHLHAGMCTTCMQYQQVPEEGTGSH